MKLQNIGLALMNLVHFPQNFLLISIQTVIFPRAKMDA